MCMPSNITQETFSEREESWAQVSVHLWVAASLGQSALNLLIPGMRALYNIITTVSDSESGFCLLSVNNREDFINSQETRLCSTIQAGSSSWSKMTTQ